MSESTRVRIRRGTSSQHSSFTGASSELTVNTTNKSLHVHDGVTPGGSELAKVDLSNITVDTLTNINGANFSGVVTASSFDGLIVGVASYASQLESARLISLSGDVSGSVLFDGSSNVSIAASIQPNSVGLGTDTVGDYVKDIVGTSNQIYVDSGFGEGSSPILSIPNQFIAPQDLRVIRDVQIDRNLNVNGNITLGGTTAFINVQELKVYDPDIVLGVRTDDNSNDISTDNTANHGGIAIASTEGTPLISLYDAGIGETNPSTYKKFMWFKSGSFSGLGTDLWISNYAIGIGSTQVPNGVRLAAGKMQVTDTNLSVPSLNVSGISSLTSLISTNANVTNINSSGISTVNIKRVTETSLNNFNSVLSPSAGTLVIDTSQSTVVFGQLNSSVTTWEFTNVSTLNNKVTTMTLIISGNSLYTYGDACIVNGNSITNGIKWSGGSSPTSTNNYDIISFLIAKDDSGTINVFGSGNTDFS